MIKIEEDEKARKGLELMRTKKLKLLRTFIISIIGYANFLIVRGVHMLYRIEGIKKIDFSNYVLKTVYVKERNFMEVSMNIRIMIFFISCFLFSTLSADTWLQTYDPYPFDLLWNVEDVLECSDGGFAVNGTYIDDFTGLAYGFLLKTDSEGNFEWVDKDTVSFLYQTESRAIVAMVDGGILSASNTTSGGTALIKRDLGGNREYTNCLEVIYVRSMCKAYDGNIVVSGKIRIDNIPWPVLVKLDQDAEIIWSQTFILDEYEWGIITSVVPSSNGGYLLTGHVKDTETQDAILVIKTDANGDSLWTRVWDETSLDDNGRTIVETDDGEILVGGSLQYLSGFIWKLDQEGNTIWFETPQEGQSSYIKANDNNILSLSGWANDLYITKFDNDHNTIWQEDFLFNYGNGDKPFCITSQDNIVVNFTDLPYLGLIKLNPDGTDADENIVNISETVLNVYPNPFNPTTSFSFCLEEDCSVNLVIYNIKGQIVSQIDKGKMYGGTHIITWHPKNISSGVYFVKLQTNNEVLDTQKIILIK